MTCPKGSLPQPLALTLRARCRALYEAGAAFCDIEAETGVKSATARSWQRRDQWQRVSESNEVAIVEDKDIEIPEPLPEQAEQYEDDMRRAALTFSNYVAGLPGVTIAAKSQHIKNVDQVARKALKIEEKKPHSVIQIAVLAQSPAKRDSERLHSLGRPRETLELTD